MTSAQSRAPALGRGRLVRIALVTLVALVAFAARLTAQQTPASAPAGVRRLSLDDALRIGEIQSEAIDIARAGVGRAYGQRMQTRSQMLPQINGTAGYTNTLRSQFSSLATTTPVDTGPPAPPSLCAPRLSANATQAERNAALAQAITCPAASGGFDFTKTGFGARNQWVLGLQFSQTLFSGGRIQGQNTAADAQLRSAGIEVVAQRAQAQFEVTQAYYDAVLTDQLVAIADSSLAETGEVLRQTRLARQVGNQSEFDLLRAQVTHDNQQPVVIQQRSNREVAYLRLKQLLNFSLDDQIVLTTRIEGTGGPAVPAIATSVVPDTSISDRAPVRQLEQAVVAQEGLLRAAKAERIPSLAVVSSYQRLYFPTGAITAFGVPRENMTVGLSTNFPIFTGGRIKGSEMVAQASLDETRAQLRRTREFAALDTRVALNDLAQAEAQFSASAGTAEQAQRAYDIDQVRYREGISTQTDLTQSRLLVEQAAANRALAARNLAVARVRLALLRDLPLQAGTSASAAAASGTVTAPGTINRQPTQQQQRATQQTAGGQANPLGGIQP